MGSYIDDLFLIINLLASQEEGSEGGRNQPAWEKWSNDGTERQVAKLMEENVGAAMQFLQSKALCIMPISLASAIYHTQPPDSSSVVKPESNPPPQNHLAVSAEGGMCIPTILKGNGKKKKVKEKKTYRSLLGPMACVRSSQHSQLFPLHLWWVLVLQSKSDGIVILLFKITFSFCQNRDGCQCPKRCKQAVQVLTSSTKARRICQSFT